MDTALLARLQFALTVMFHYLFPPLTIGLGGILVTIEAIYLRTKAPFYLAMARFWTRIFAVTFALGVATGIVMEFQFGTNWAAYSRFVGDVFGSALAAEGIFAFFLESGFLAVLVFGWDKVSPRVHFFSTLMVALGSAFSAIWIVVANSWQQTPSGFRIVRHGTQTRAEITDFWAMVFSPSSMDRLVHVLLGAYILGAFFVMSITAFYLLKGRHLEFARKSFVIALVVAAVAVFSQGLSGHSQGRVVANHQPAKLAAFEGLYQHEPGGTRLTLFGLPDPAEQRVKAAVAIPKLLSWLVYSDPNRPVKALDEFPRSDWPPVPLSFHAYHIMVGLGFSFMGLLLLALVFWWKGKLFQTRWLLWTFVFAVLGPFAANELGWVAAEVGRQPWAVYGLLRTSDGLSKVVKADAIVGSIAMFAVIYLLLFLVWLYVLNDKIQHGPEEAGVVPGATTPEGLLETAGRLKAHRGFSMTEADGTHDESKED